VHPLNLEQRELATTAGCSQSTVLTSAVCARSLARRTIYTQVGSMALSSALAG